MHLLSQLNPQQRRACEITEGPVLVLAGAGSGKTRTLTYRIAYLIKELGVAPEAILAFTFTNKAAQEMRDRVEALVGAAVRSMWLGTFHAVAARILRQEIAVMGYGPRFGIYDAEDARNLVREILREMGLDDKKWPPAQLLSHISRAKNAFLTPDDWSDASFFGRRVQEVYARYQERLRALNALDFDDLIFLTVQLFDRFPEVLARYHRRFQYVLVDEYQDTNLAQYRLIRQLAAGHRNLCVVGDDDQSIYGWRGADVRNILEFQREFPDATVIRLEENYRSTGNILAAANAVVRNNRERLGKELWTRKEPGERISVYEAPDENAEAWQAAQIVGLAVQQGIKPSECAILYRTNAQSRAFEMALSRVGLGYRLVGGKRFYERKEVRDLVAYLKVVYNPLDDLALLRIINFPRRGLGEVALERLAAYQRERGIALYQTLGEAEAVAGLSPAGQRAAQELCELFGHWRAVAAEGDLAQLVRTVAEESGLLPLYQREGTSEAEDRLENLGELISEARRFQIEQGTADLGDFLSWVALVSEWDQTDQRSDGVWLMTVHSAKGLEFPLVVLAGLEEGIFPHARAFDEPSGLEEERRLFYVAVTRACRRLVLMHAKTRIVQGRAQSNPPSRFLTEIPEELLEPLDFVRPREGAKVERGATCFTLGETVTHPRFGRGTVVATRGEGEDTEVTIAFPGGGVRSFLAKYAQLIKEA
ncbi:MAG: UvrD-helicase domain-containing protein [Firmicutes bacterium]|nr:UvrD-helicase domain-containing protein [Alicyclobacillaceae bacterium]MCL6497904.1 UvrD-helicase domain-containing protein [Bacillota bacterium]